MKHFIKLLNFEVNRLSKFLFSLMGLVFIANLIGTILNITNSNRELEQYMIQNSFSQESAILDMGTVTLRDLLLFSSFFQIPIMIGIAGLVFYMFFIWYREWFGKNTFAYRLLMLPVNRMILYFTKFIALLLGILSLVSLQYLSLYLTNILLQTFLKEGLFAYVSPLRAVTSDILLPYLLPNTPLVFLAVYGIFAVVILCIFTAILFERSYQIKGLIIGILYCIGALLLSISVFLVPEFSNNYYILFYSETIVLFIATLLIISGLSIYLSYYLLNHKITI